MSHRNSYLNSIFVGFVLIKLLKSIYSRCFSGGAPIFGESCGWKPRKLRKISTVSSPNKQHFDVRQIDDIFCCKKNLIGEEIERQSIDVFSCAARGKYVFLVFPNVGQ